MMRRRMILTVVCFLSIAGLILCVTQLEPSVREISFTDATVAELQLIIDAGHGGEDGGAVSLSGVKESDINLAIALKLDEILGLYGVSTTLLRTDDSSLHSEDAETIHEKKVADLNYRVETIESTINAVVISIHQNTYSSPQYSGAQVFYSNHERSLPLAELAQEALIQWLNPDNTRVATAIPDSIYLMNHISCPAILVECGFLSNPEEEALLITSDYQTQVAATLATVWLQYQG